MNRRSGRRPGKQDTRGAILSAARKVFAEAGYDKASIRRIASAAGVDPALVHHYFGTKEKLFLAVVQVPFAPEAMISKVFAEGEEGIAERMVRTFVSVWEGPVTGPAMAGVVRSAASHRRGAGLVRELFSTQIVRRVMQTLGDRIEPEEIPLRASLVAGQLLGLALARYIFKLEPLAAADEETVVAAVAPNIHRYLFGDLSSSTEEA